MAEYRLLIKPSAAKEVEAVGTKRGRQRIVGRIQSLATDPNSPGSEKLAGSTALFRVRQGHYRVIHTVDDAHRTIEVIKVGHRREVYLIAPNLAVEGTCRHAASLRSTSGRHAPRLARQAAQNR